MAEKAPIAVKEPPKSATPADLNRKGAEPPPPPPPEVTGKRRAKTATTGVPDGYTGETTLVECHTCGAGIGAALGELRVPTELAALADQRKLTCQKCGHGDVSVVKLTDALRDELDQASLRRTNAILEETVAQLQQQIAVMQKQSNRMQPIAPDPVRGERGPERGQHRE